MMDHTFGLGTENFLRPKALFQEITHFVGTFKMQISGHGMQAFHRRNLV